MLTQALAAAARLPLESAAAANRLAAGIAAARLTARDVGALLPDACRALGGPTFHPFS